MSVGTILSIQRFCTDDGPGIRSTVFMKGCPLRCLWCHNPESQKEAPEVFCDTAKCIVCGGCKDVCKNGCHTVDARHYFSFENCSTCGKCIDSCTSGAIGIYGKKISADEVFAEILRDKIFYDTSCGGVTLSGGEPLFQPDFSADILRLCRDVGIHTAIETCGFSDERSLISVVNLCDTVLFDIKETDEERHKHYTGSSFKTIFKNLSIINDLGIPFIIRAPIIPTVNDRASHFEKLKHISKQMKFCGGVQIMPYHNIGTHKYESLGRKYECESINVPSTASLNKWKSIF